jgi:protocatechuate 3,4-dioxygenase beta subunit
VIKPFVLLLAVLPVQAAYLQCFVVDSDTGRPLARATVTVEGVQGGQSLSRSSFRTDRAGSSAIGPVADGAYIVTISRPAFATQQYGQTGWNRPGLPLMIQGDRPVAIQIRLRRLPSISGTVWDENQVGIPNAPVVVYTANRPAKLVGKATTDDRGIYRVGELVPGTYVVRNAAKQFEDTLSIIPTFYPDGNSFVQARTVEIDLDHSAQEVNFSPAQGRLFHLTGRVAMSRPAAGTIELISDTGRTSAGFDQNGAFSFEGLAPGTYDLFSQSNREAGWIRLLVDRDEDGVRLDMRPLGAVNIMASDQDHNRIDVRSMTLFARRKDLDADGPVIPVADGRTLLAPGPWELAVSTVPTLYPLSVHPYPTAEGRSSGRADGWNSFRAGPYPAIQVTVSTHPAVLHGRVFFSANNPAPQVPVFLETLDTNPEEPPQVRTTRTDQNGIYRFAGLPPGRYLVVSSYDADPTSRAAIEAAHPQDVTLHDSSDESQDLQIQIN